MKRATRRDSIWRASARRPATAAGASGRAWKNLIDEDAFPGVARRRISGRRVDVRRSGPPPVPQADGRVVCCSPVSTGCEKRRVPTRRCLMSTSPKTIVPGVAALLCDRRDCSRAMRSRSSPRPMPGRPTKLDGNPDHPVTRGASDPFMQSAIFGLYDPDRSKTPLRDGGPATWARSCRTRALRDRWRDRQGEGLRILTGATTSPTLIRQMAELAKQYPKMRWHRFEPVGTAARTTRWRSRSAARSRRTIDWTNAT